MLTQCRPATSQDFPAIGRMLELYQYELSDIWDQELNEAGEFEYDLSHHIKGQDSFAHVARVNERFAGFALVAPALLTRKEGLLMEQFFILKKYRKSGVGRKLARHVFQFHPGAWEVGQLPANYAAQAFWRNVIAEFTAGEFTEVQVTEGWWRGIVQRFNFASAA